MSNQIWSDSHPILGWFLWFGFVLLIFGSLGDWGQIFRSEKRNKEKPATKDDLATLNERYARGEINQDEYHRMKADISNEDGNTSTKTA